MTTQATKTPRIRLRYMSADVRALAEQHGCTVKTAVISSPDAVGFERIRAITIESPTGFNFTSTVDGNKIQLSALTGRHRETSTYHLCIDREYASAWSDLGRILAVGLTPCPLDCPCFGGTEIVDEL